MKFRFNMIFTALFMIAAMPTLADGGQENPVVANVNGQKIYLADVLARQQQVPQLAQAPLESVYRPILEQIVTEILIQKEVSDTVKNDDPEVVEARKKCEEMAKAQVHLDRILKKRVTQKDLINLYDESVKNFKAQPVANVSHILVSDKKTADQVISRLNKNESFEKLAKEFSKDTMSKNRGGVLGPVIKDVATQAFGPEFAETIFVLKPGHHARHPIKGPQGYHVVHVGSRGMSEPPALESVMDQLRNIVAQEQLAKYFQELKKKNKVQMMDMNGRPLPEMTSKKK